MRILGLNKNFVPVKFCNHFSAIGKLFCDNARAIKLNGNNIEEYNWENWLRESLKDSWPAGQDFIQSISQRVAIPRVIRYLRYNRIPKHSVRLTRKAIYERDGYLCCYCGQELAPTHLTLDHVVPLSKGGQKTWENLVTCCESCNFKKGDKSLKQLGWKQKYQAHKPVVSILQLLKYAKDFDYPEWTYFGV
jgi:5-methylcytosine-specific restriction endonuclease McrA